MKFFVTIMVLFCEVLFCFVFPFVFNSSPPNKFAALRMLEKCLFYPCWDQSDWLCGFFLEESLVQLFPHAMVWMSRFTHNFHAEYGIMCMFFYYWCFDVHGHGLCFDCRSCKLSYVCDCPDAARVISGNKL